MYIIEKIKYLKFKMKEWNERTGMDFDDLLPAMQRVWHDIWSAQFKDIWARKKIMEDSRNIF